MKNTRKLFKRGVFGFSLIELMIVIGIVALLVALALPSYKQFIRKSNRGEAQQMLMNWANLQEIWRSNHTTFADDVAAPGGIPVPTAGDVPYTFSLAAPNPPTAIAYVLVATATGDQVNDKDKGVSCTPLQITQANTKTPPECW